MNFVGGFIPRPAYDFVRFFQGEDSEETHRAQERVADIAFIALSCLVSSVVIQHSTEVSLSPLVGKASARESAKVVTCFALAALKLYFLRSFPSQVFVAISMSGCCAGLWSAAHGAVCGSAPHIIRGLGVAMISYLLGSQYREVDERPLLMG